MSKTKRKSKQKRPAVSNSMSKRLRLLTQSIVVFHRYSEGWTESNKRFADVLFMHLVDAGSCNDELRDTITESALNVPRNWEVQINVYCKDANGDRYIESTELVVKDIKLRDLEAFIETKTTETISAVNEKHWFDKEWIATPQSSKPINWPAIGRRVNNYLKRKAK